MQCEQIWADRNNKSFPILIWHDRMDHYKMASWNDNLMQFILQYNIFVWFTEYSHRAINIITHMAVFHSYDYFCIILVIVWWDCVFLNSYPEMIFTPRNHFSNGTFLYPAKTSDSLFSPFQIYRVDQNGFNQNLLQFWHVTYDLMWVLHDTNIYLYFVSRKVISSFKPYILKSVLMNNFGPKWFDSPCRCCIIIHIQ